MAKPEDAIRIRAALKPWKVGSRAGAAVLLPAEASRAMGRRGPAPIRTTVNGYGFGASARPPGKPPVRLGQPRSEGSSVRRGGGVCRRGNGGEDRAAQVAIPEDLRSAYSRSPEANDLFENLPPSHQRA
jgi:hypothetical protein